MCPSTHLSLQTHIPQQQGRTQSEQQCKRNWEVHVLPPSYWNFSTGGKQCAHRTNTARSTIQRLSAEPRKGFCSPCTNFCSGLICCVDNKYSSTESKTSSHTKLVRAHVLRSPSDTLLNPYKHLHSHSLLQFSREFPQYFHLSARKYLQKPDQRLCDTSLISEVTSLAGFLFQQQFPKS